MQNLTAAGGIQHGPRVKIGIDVARTTIPRAVSDIFAHRTDEDGTDIHYVSCYSAILSLSCLKLKCFYQYDDSMTVETSPVQVTEGVARSLHLGTESPSTDRTRSSSLSDSDSIPRYVEDDHSARSSVRGRSRQSIDGDGSLSDLQQGISSLLSSVRLLSTQVDVLSRSLPTDEHSSTESSHVSRSPFSGSRLASAETSLGVSPLSPRSPESLSPAILHASPVDYYPEPQAGTAAALTDEPHRIANKQDVEFEEHLLAFSVHTDRFVFVISPTFLLTIP